MKAAPLPPRHDEHQKLLRHLELLDAAPEEIFDSITRIATLICDVPVAIVSLTESCRQWFRPRAADSTIERAASFCARAIEQDETQIIPDALADARFSDDALMRSEPAIRFFACLPLKLAPNIRVGTLCLIDHRPRTLDTRQLDLLELLAAQATLLIKLRLDKVESNREFSILTSFKHKLQFQKEMMEAILDNEPEGVAIVSPDGRLERLNAAALAMLETPTLSSAQTQAMADFMLVEFREGYYLMLSKVLLGEHIVQEYRMRGRLGTERWLEIHAAPLYDQASHVASLIFVMRDVTELKESRARLELAARVFGEAQEGIIITDRDSVILDVNPTFCAITGYSREEIIGQTPVILRSGLQGPEFYSALWKVLIDTGRWKGEIWNRKKNGELYAELISISALRDAAGNIINYVGLFLDITEIKQRQGQRPPAP